MQAPDQNACRRCLALRIPAVPARLPGEAAQIPAKGDLPGNPAVAPAGGVTLPGITDDDETVDIVEIPAGVADIGVGNLELTVHITLFPGGIAEKQTVQCAGTGDKCVGAEDGDERAGGKSHVKFQTALVIPDLNADKSAVFPLFLTVVFVKVRDKTFVCRQNGHFLFGVFYGSICKEETRYDDRKAEE